MLLLLLKLGNSITINKVMANITVTAVVHDPHSLAVYDVKSGAYQGIIYVTSGTIVGQPIITEKQLTISFQ
jgi:hypothetical protein